MKPDRTSLYIICMYVVVAEHTNIVSSSYYPAAQPGAHIIQILGPVAGLTCAPAI